MKIKIKNLHRIEKEFNRFKNDNTLTGNYHIAEISRAFLNTTIIKFVKEDHKLFCCRQDIKSYFVPKKPTNTKQSLEEIKQDSVMVNEEGSEYWCEEVNSFKDVMHYLIKAIYNITETAYIWSEVTVHNITNLILTQLEPSNYDNGDNGFIYFDIFPQTAKLVFDPYGPEDCMNKLKLAEELLTANDIIHYTTPQLRTIVVLLSDNEKVCNLLSGAGITGVTIED